MGAVEGFDEGVVAAVNRYVDFAPVGLVAGGVHEDEVPAEDLVGGKARMAKIKAAIFCAWAKQAGFLVWNIIV